MSGTKIKVGILTFHNAYNYGAFLQCFALHKYVEKSGFSCNVINYHNENVDKCYFLKKGRFYLKRPIKSIINTMKATVRNKKRKQKYNKYDELVGVFLNLDDFNLAARNYFNEHYDIIIVGSDQIWNPAITGYLDDYYFINLDYKGIKIAYSASNGSNNIDDKEINYYKDTLLSFKYISTRESGLASNLEKILKKPIYHNLDPTLLLNKEDYYALMSYRHVKPIFKTYIFAYFVNENKLLEEICDFLSDFYDLPIIELHDYTNRKSTRKREVITNCDPSEFLYFLANSNFCLTNSFHGTAFSIIFEKQFYSVYKEDSRKDDLLNILGLESRHISSFLGIKLEESIDYKKVYMKLNKYRNKSNLFVGVMYECSKL